MGLVPGREGEFFGQRGLLAAVEFACVERFLEALLEAGAVPEGGRVC